MKEKRKPENLYPEKIFFKYEGKIIFRLRKDQRLHHQHICTIVNVKGNPLGRRKMIADGILDPHK